MNVARSQRRPEAKLCAQSFWSWQINGPCWPRSTRGARRRLRVPTPGCIEAVAGLIIKSLERDIARRRFASDQGSRRRAMNDEHSEYLRQAGFCRGMAV